MTTFLNLTAALEDCLSQTELAKNEIFLNLKQSQVKTNDQLTGEILLDLKRLIGNSTIILTIQCKERVFKESDCIFEEIVMSVKSEVFQIGSDVSMVVPHIYKIPLNIIIPEIFNSSEYIKFDNDLSAKIEYEIFCQVVQSIDLPQESQVKIASKSFIRRSNETTINQINPNLEGKVILQSSVIPLQIINNSNTKKSQPVAITQLVPHRQRSLFKSLGSLLCCKGSSDKTQKLINQQKSYIKHNEVTHFEIDMNTINLYPGETFSFLIKDDGKKPDLNQEIRYQVRLVSKQTLKVKGQAFLDQTKILYEKQVPKNTSEKVIIPYQSQLSYTSNTCKISYELQVTPLGYSFEDKICLHAPIHINPKKFKLIPLMNDNKSDDSEIGQLRQSVQRLLSFPHKVIAKISLKFDDQIEDQKEIPLSQKSTNLNTPDITPLRRSFE